MTALSSFWLVERRKLLMTSPKTISIRIIPDKPMLFSIPNYPMTNTDTLDERGYAISSGDNRSNSFRNCCKNSFKSPESPVIIIFSASLILTRHGAGVDDLTASILMILS